jgi:hypothetical protein
MISSHLEVWQTAAENHIIEKLPDGSTAVFDALTRTVHSINKTATAAFDACRDKRNVSELVTAMRETLESPVTEEMALAAVFELERVGLVACSASTHEERLQASRRSVLRAVGTAAATVAPLVLSLSSAEQSAYAAAAGSGTAQASIDGDDSNTVCTDIASPQSLNIAGQNTHFSQASSVVSLSVPWLTITNVTVFDPTSITVTFLVAASHPSGSGTFGAGVVTGSESVSAVNIFAFQNCR